MSRLPLDLLESGAAELGISLTESQLGQFETFAHLLIETNRELNLTRITDPRDIVVHHYLDSLTVLNCEGCFGGLPTERVLRVIDVGTGAGFPGIPLSIARPDLRMTLLDSVGKKLSFVSRAVRQLGLVNVECVQMRAEDAGRDSAHRESYDVAVTRALAEMRILAELCLPLVKVGGKLIAQKSTDIEDELAAAKPIIGQLGGKPGEVQHIRIPESDIERSLIVVTKAQPTPDTFPRPYARIVRRASAN